MGLRHIVARETETVVIVTDYQGRTLWANSAANRLCGYGLAEMWGRKPGELLQGPATDTRTVREMREAVHHGKCFDGRILNYHKDGRIYEVEIHFAPVVDPEGEVETFVATESEFVSELSFERRKLVTRELKELLTELMQRALVADRELPSGLSREPGAPRPLNPGGDLTI